MAQSLRPEFHTNLADLVLADLQLLKANYYFYLGKLEPWDIAHDVITSTYITASQYQDDLIRSNIVYITKISPNDISLAAPRVVWTSGTFYDRWDHTEDMTLKNFYVITSENKVFKCLDNNKGSASSVEPSVVSYDVTPTADGYLWKYMFSVPLFKRTKFLNPLFIPVQNAISDSFYNKGAIEDIAVINQGSGYTDVPLTHIGISGGTTTGINAAATVATVNAAGTILTITVSNGGTGYTKGLTYNITSTHGVGAVLTPIIAAGVLTGFGITNGGVSYSPGDNIVITVGGGVLVPLIASSTGSINGVLIVSGGSGYVTPPTLTVTQDAPAPGSALYDGNSIAIVSAMISGGSIKSVAILDPGKNYIRGGGSTITVASGDGTDAAFTPIMYNGSLFAIVIDNPGTEYTYINLQINGDGVGAEAAAIITRSDFSTDQSIVEQTAKQGAIYAIKVTVPGDNYTSATTVTITDENGTGAVIGDVDITDGHIVRITMALNQYGNNYSNPKIIITDNTRISSVGVQDAEAIAIIPPVGGHGYDSVKELSANTIVISAFLKSQLNLLNMNQDFRQYGIIRNPTDYTSGKFFKLENEVIAYECELNTITDLVKDEVLINGDYLYRVANIVDATSVWLQPLSKIMVDPVGVVTSVVGSRIYSIINVATRPTFNKYSGSLLFVSEENPFQFTSEQGLAIKTYIKF